MLPRAPIALLLTAAALFAPGASSGAQAAAARTFVSGLGVDSGGCTRTAPCRSFAYAYSQTVAGGEITVLDSAGYGPLAIIGAITITNPGGVEAGITTTSGTTAITIAAQSGDAVTLRGLTLEGGGVGLNGIEATSVGSLNIIDTVVKDFTNNGIVVEPSNGTTHLLIAGTFALNNNGTGISLDAKGSATIPFTIQRTTADGNSSGIGLNAAVSGSRIVGLVVGSHADSNTNVGITATGSGSIAPGCSSGPGGTNLYVLVKNSSASNNQNAGIEAAGTAISTQTTFAGSGVAIVNSAFLNNGEGDVFGNCGLIYSGGDNEFFSVEVGAFGGGVGSYSEH